MPFPVPEGRRPKRVATNRPASIVFSRGRHHDLERRPCLIVDSSQDGFRLRGNFQLKRGQVIEVIPKDDPLDVIQCSVVWIGKEGSKQKGEVGVQIV